MPDRMFSRKEKRISFSAIIWILALSVLACQPVIAIGWNEFLIVSILFALLLRPLIYRFLRRVEDFLKRRQQDN